MGRHGNGAVSRYEETETIPTVITKWLNEYRTTFLNENHIVYQYSRKKTRQADFACKAGG